MKKVLITTQYRGVYVGDLKDHDKTERHCTLLNARMCITWGTANGVDQLALEGPQARGKYGSIAKEIWIPGLTSVVECTDKAAAAWDKL